MKHVAIIVAYDESRGIGKDGKIPWWIKGDTKHFNAMTKGCPVVMGRKTWDSLPNKYRPLPWRINLVVSRGTPDVNGCASTFVRPDLQDAIKFGVNAFGGERTVWVCGGAEIYREAIPLVDEIVVTEIKGEYDCDTFFPSINESEWYRGLVRYEENFNVVRYRRKT